MIARAWGLLAALTVGCASLLSAQGAEPPAAVLNGVVWDSLAGRPLPDAEILLDGKGIAALSGADGSFTLHAAAGRHRVTFRHPDLSAWSALVPTVEVDLTEARPTRVALATLSSRSLLQRTCGGRGAVVGGRVLDLLTLVPLSAASVDIRTARDGASNMVTVGTEGDGSFQACLAPGQSVEVRARLGSTRGRPVTLLPDDGPVYVRDLFLQVAEPARVEGLVRDGSTGRPLPDAVVEILGTRLRAATRPDGRFAFRGVPPGDVNLIVERIGYGRRVVDLSAAGGTTVEMTLDVFPEAVSLDSMVVSVRGGTAERMRSGVRFDGLTRPEIEKLLPRSLAFDDLIRNANVPGLRIRQFTHQAPNGIRYPGLCIETARTSTIDPRGCEMVEVYLNGVRLPEPDQVLEALDPGSIDRFQLLSRTEAGVQYGGTPHAGNGVLLIYTRGR